MEQRKRDTERERDFISTKLNDCNIPSPLQIALQQSLTAPESKITFFIKNRGKNIQNQKMEHPEQKI